MSGQLVEEDQFLMLYNNVVLLVCNNIYFANVMTTAENVLQLPVNKHCITVYCGSKRQT